MAKQTQEIEVGQKWFAKLPGSNKLRLVMIREIRNLVVLLDTGDLKQFGIQLESNEWFELDAVRFVQQEPT